MSKGPDHKKYDKRLLDLDTKWDKLQVKFINKKNKINELVAESKSMINGCKLNAMMLINLINDLLDLAKEEHLTFQLHKNYFNLLDTINGSFETLKFISESRNIKTEVFIKPEHEKYFQYIYGDANRYQ